MMAMEINADKTKNLEEMAEEATVDCYNDYEMFAGWACTLEDELPLPLKCQILGEEATLVGIDTDDSGTSVLGIIEKGNERIRIPIQGIKPVNKNIKELMWIDAYKHWLGE